MKRPNPLPHYPKPPYKAPPPPPAGGEATTRELLERIEWKLDLLMQKQGYGWRGGPR